MQQLSEEKKPFSAVPVWHEHVACVSRVARLIVSYGSPTFLVFHVRASLARVLAAAAEGLLPTLRQVQHSLGFEHDPAPACAV